MKGCKADAAALSHADTMLPAGHPHACGRLLGWSIVQLQVPKAVCSPTVDPVMCFKEGILLRNRLTSWEYSWTYAELRNTIASSGSQPSAWPLRAPSIASSSASSILMRLETKEDQTGVAHVAEVSATADWVVERHRNRVLEERAGAR